MRLIEPTNQIGEAMKMQASHYAEIRAAFAVVADKVKASAPPVSRGRTDRKAARMGRGAVWIQGNA